MFFDSAKNAAILVPNQLKIDELNQGLVSYLDMRRDTGNRLREVITGNSTLAFSATGQPRTLEGFFRFDGVNDYLQHNETLLKGWPVTLSAVIRNPNYSGSSLAVLCLGTDTQNHIIRLDVRYINSQWRGQSVVLNTDVDASQTETLGSTSSYPFINEIAVVTLVCVSNTERHLYQNGVRILSGTTNIAWNTNTRKVAVAAIYNRGIIGNYQRADIVETRVYNRALSHGEVARLANYFLYESNFEAFPTIFFGVTAPPSASVAYNGSAATTAIGLGEGYAPTIAIGVATTAQAPAIGLGEGYAPTIAIGVATTAQAPAIGLGQGYAPTIAIGVATTAQAPAIGLGEGYAPTIAIGVATTAQAPAIGLGQGYSPTTNIGASVDVAADSTVIAIGQGYAPTIAIGIAPTAQAPAIGLGEGDAPTIAIGVSVSSQTTIVALGIGYDATIITTSVAETYLIDGIIIAPSLVADGLIHPSYEILDDIEPTYIATDKIEKRSILP